MRYYLSFWMNSSPWAPLLLPYLTGVVTSPCSQGQGWPRSAPVGWHLPPGPKHPGSLADNSTLPRNPRSGGHLWTQPELLGPEGRSCSLHYGVWPRGSTETPRNLERQCPLGQAFNIHRTSAS